MYPHGGSSFVLVLVCLFFFVGFFLFWFGFFWGFFCLLFFFCFGFVLLVLFFLFFRGGFGFVWFFFCLVFFSFFFPLVCFLLLYSGLCLQYQIPHFLRVTRNLSNSTGARYHSMLFHLHLTTGRT